VPNRIVPFYTIATDYDQAGEDALAAGLTGQSIGALVIFNTTLGKTRIWNGSAFINAPILSPDGGTWPTTAAPDWSAITNKPSTFAPATHNHDSSYAATNHNHDSAYAAAAHTHSSLSASGVITSSGGGIGYVTGAGGTISQLTSRTTGVTLNKLSGTITMFSAAQAAQALVTFTFTNSNIASTDYILVQHMSATNGGAWNISIVASNGSCTISIRNVSSASITEATPLRFFILKSSNS
jgi:hypothetical protein